MRIDDIAETCEIESKQSIPPVNDNDAILNSIADKVESVVSAKLAEFEKTVNTADQQFNNNSTNAVVTDTAVNDDSTNNDSANSGAESE